MKNLNTALFVIASLIFLACETATPEKENLPKDATIDDTLILEENIEILPETVLEPLPIENYTSELYDEIGWELMQNESFGGVKTNMDSIAITTILGQPDSITQELFWGADGGFHSEWIYTQKGITIGINRVPDHPDTTYHQPIVDRMYLYAPSEFSTNRRISIGSSISDVMSSYQKAIGDTENFNQALVAGSVYGGLIFQFQNDTVIEIFLGAAAE